MANQLEREIARLLNLKNYKGMEDNELETIARRNIEIREFKKNPLFDTSTDEGKKEQESAETRFRNYLQNNEIDSASDIDTLKSLIYNEIFELKIQKELNSSKIPPEKLTKQLVDIQNQKSSLKIKLGIDKTEEEQDDLSKLQLLQKRFHKYIQEHKNEFTLKIPFKCSKCNHEDVSIHLLRQRVTNFDALPHPWFAGNWFFNYEIIKDVKEGKLSAEDAWRYLCSASKGSETKPAFNKTYCTDYINYCIENWTLITSFLEDKK